MRSHALGCSKQGVGSQTGEFWGGGFLAAVFVKTGDAHAAKIVADLVVPPFRPTPPPALAATAWQRLMMCDDG